MVVEDEIGKSIPVSNDEYVGEAAEDSDLFLDCFSKMQTSLEA